MKSHIQGILGGKQITATQVVVVAELLSQSRVCGIMRATYTVSCQYLSELMHEADTKQSSLFLFSAFRVPQ